VKPIVSRSHRTTWRTCAKRQGERSPSRSAVLRLQPRPVTVCDTRYQQPFVTGVRVRASPPRPIPSLINDQNGGTSLGGGE
jgi:hypothetical protein